MHEQRNIFQVLIDMICHLPLKIPKKGKGSQASKKKHMLLSTLPLMLVRQVLSSNSGVYIPTDGKSRLLRKYAMKL
jgi:hypothetical protein